MAKLKAYPKGSTESIEWTLGATEEDDVETLASSLLGKRPGVVTLMTSTGLLQIDAAAYAALEIVK